MFYFTPSRRVLAWITRIHRSLYLATRGIIGDKLPQLDTTAKGLQLHVMHVLLLTTKGRKSAQWRTIPLPCFSYEGRTFVVGSNAAMDNPAWYLNLLEHPEVEIQVGASRRRGRAVVATGAERARLWTMLTEEWPRYRLYQERVAREIPLVELVTP